MGMQGPLTAQALGRSPYDDVVDWPDVDTSNAGQQQFDHRGRAVNPETKRQNRDIVRAHNEVMLVIGVAEADNPGVNPEAESEAQHIHYENAIGSKIGASTNRCIETMGIFGVHGLRQRILIYQKYSEIPFHHLYQEAKSNFVMSRDILAGAPSALLTSYIERYMAHLWFANPDRSFARRCTFKLWGWVRAHLELFSVYQRLGLVSRHHWFPTLWYFVPFTAESPIPAPPPMDGLGLPSLLRWFGGLCSSAIPFVLWVIVRRTMNHWRLNTWTMLFQRVPSTFLHRKLPTPSPPPSPSPSPPLDSPQPFSDNNVVTATETHRTEERAEESSPSQAIDTQPAESQEPVEAARRSSIFSSRGDDGSDDDENDGVTRTLISFDIEATETNDTPPGNSWSAELRPSQMADSGQALRTPVVYFDTLLTRFPAMLACNILSDTLIGIAIAPFEGAILRLMARSFLTQRGLPCLDIYRVNLLSGLNWTWLNNFLTVEFLQLLLAGEVWGTTTAICMYYHMNEEEWKAHQEKQERRRESDIPGDCSG